jgi:hypothetical protein
MNLKKGMEGQPWTTVIRLVLYDPSYVAIAIRDLGILKMIPLYYGQQRHILKPGFDSGGFPT